MVSVDVVAPAPKFIVPVVVLVYKNTSSDGFVPCILLHSKLANAKLSVDIVPPEITVPIPSSIVIIPFIDFVV
jgi:hypothetical protein